MNASSPALRRVAVALVAGLGLAGCQGAAFWSGSSSMRIDVEVYKGPLSKDPNIQLGELVGLTKETKNAFISYRELLRGVAQEVRDCYVPIEQPRGGPTVARPDFGRPFALGAVTAAPRQSWYATGQNLPQNSVTGFCGWLAALDEETSRLLQDGDVIETMLGSVGTDPEVLRATPRDLRNAMTRIAEASIRLKAKAGGWAVATAAFMPDSYAVRISTSNFMVTAAEYANQLSSHADALLQQMAGVDRRELPMSVLLRDTTPTQFLNTYVWNRAAAPALSIDQVYRPGSAFSSEETRDRVRVVERLYADHHWTRINTAFATGQGEAAMAFIKDDIGNWNLKSFDNDPSELLRAYRNMGFAGLDMATKAIANMASAGGASAAMGLLDTANRVALGRSAAPPQVGGVGVETLHRRTLDRLVQMKAAVAAEHKTLGDLAAAQLSKSRVAEEELKAARKRMSDELLKTEGKSSEEHRRAATEFEAQALSKENEVIARRNDALAEAAAGNNEKASQLRGQANGLFDEATKLKADAVEAKRKAATAQAAEIAAESIRNAEVVPAEARQKKAADDLAATEREIATLTARRSAEAVRLLEGHIDLIGLMEQSAAGAAPGGMPTGPLPGGGGLTVPAGLSSPVRPAGF